MNMDNRGGKYSIVLGFRYPYSISKYNIVLSIWSSLYMGRKKIVMGIDIGTRGYRMSGI
jgi:hypothetical protein